MLAPPTKRLLKIFGPDRPGMSLKVSPEGKTQLPTFKEQTKISIPSRDRVLPVEGTSNGATRRDSLWKGPHVDGITYSLLCKFLQCPERFRLQVVEGWKEVEKFNPAMNYGTMFHHCMEAHQAGQPWQPSLQKYIEKLCEQFPSDTNEIVKWQSLCSMQFPIYVSHWKNHPTEKRQRVTEEQSFKIEFPVKTLSYVDQCSSVWEKMLVLLRGQIDAIYTTQPGKIRVGYVQENKTKGDIDVLGLDATIDQLLQTTIYQIAARKLHPNIRFAGTLYNVIRRPMADKKSPRQRKKETFKTYLGRLEKFTKENTATQFFRWQKPITQKHINRVCRETITPLLNYLVLWWDLFQGDPFSPEKNPIHYRYPFGAYHSMERGFRGDYFDLLTRGTYAGLRKIEDLFPEVR